MSLRFVFGPSGAGKSYQLYQEILDRAGKEKARNFLIVVPDQFTMQTQKDLVSMSQSGGIMNIDVLSFGRLSHRIFEEVGSENTPVLDDTGKSLVLQRVAAGAKDKLKVLGSYLSKQGYIHEVKSAISEFMQYGIGVGDMQELINYADKRGALSLKLQDLQVLYREFTDYIAGHFITTEERLDRLRSVLYKSEILKGSVVVFDGFTGFTPIQNRLIGEVMRHAAEVVVTVTLGEGEDPYELGEPQKLFYLSKKTIFDLDKEAKHMEVARGEDTWVKGSARFANAPGVCQLERRIFRGKTDASQTDAEDIILFDAPTVKEEVRQSGLYIKQLVRDNSYAYRDIAVVCGNLESYASYVESEFASMGIPCSIDKTRQLRLNAMVEFIRSALEVVIHDYSYETVFHYLRSGLTTISAKEIDALEEYVIATGVRGGKAWKQMFTHKTKAMGEDEDALASLNATREQLVLQLSELKQSGKMSAKEHVEALYRFLVQNHVANKLEQMAQKFEEGKDLVRAKEYSQIYRLIMELLEQIHGLLATEEITAKEFLEILEAGFAEIEVGTIPQNVDRIVVGDIERTRLKQVKALFFLGVNDGNIPKSGAKGGIISDMDREFLSLSGVELAPSPRQQMYIQRFYLYQNLTKPSERLYLSYAKVSGDGKSLRPAYLVDTVRNLFPLLSVEHPWNAPVFDQIVTREEGLNYLANGLSDYVSGYGEKMPVRELFTLFEAYKQFEEADRVERLADAAFVQYEDSLLSKEVARALYGVMLENSVSRLETYASCAYHHFLQYGLSLSERTEFGFEAVDMGNIFHDVLERFVGYLEGSGYTWFDFPEQFAADSVKKALEETAVSYGAGVLYHSARSEYAIARMERILNRSLLTLQNHLQKGDFKPEGYEVSFHYAKDLESVSIALSEDEKMRLRGRIDRIDVAEDDDNLYVKIIDYKSGDKQFDLAALYRGLQLQLVVYMNAAVEMMAKKRPDKHVVPAAILYYHVSDPMVETQSEISSEELNQKILEELRMKGVVNADDGIVDKLDRFMGDKSDVIPVEKKKDGTFSARSKVMSSEELGIVSQFVSGKVRELGKEIMEGRIAHNPYEDGNRSACTFCAYKKVCGFDTTIPGFSMREFEKFSEEEILVKMKQEVDGHGI